MKDNITATGIARRKPHCIPSTSRQRVTARNGVTLERQYVFMPTESWEALQRLCYGSQQSGSQVIQNLISIADLGKLKDKSNESTSNTGN